MSKAPSAASPPPSAESSIGGRGQPPSLICFGKITGPFHRLGSPLTFSRPPPVSMNYTPVPPSQKGLPQKYGARQWRSEPQQSRQFSSKGEVPLFHSPERQLSVDMFMIIHWSWPIFINKVAFKQHEAVFILKSLSFFSRMVRLLDQTDTFGIMAKWDQAAAVWRRDATEDAVRSFPTWAMSVCETDRQIERERLDHSCSRCVRGCAKTHKTETWRQLERTLVTFMETLSDS